MSLVISDELLQTARMSEAELRQEIAILLFQKEKLTLGQASKFADMNQVLFRHLLASRQIPLHYDIQELHEIEVVPWTVPMPVAEPAWMKFAGAFQNDPDFAEIMEELCAERNSEDESEVDSFYL